MKFKSRKPHYEHLRKKWAVRHRVARDNFWDRHGKTLKHLTLASLGGLMLLSPPHQQLPAPHFISSRDDILEGYDQNVLLAQALQDKLPKEVRPLDFQEEREMVDVLTRYFGFKVIAEINNIKLNRNYGLIGGEQHLYRYPGDNLYAHASNSVEWVKYGSAGIAPNLGAWGYFATDKKELSEIGKLRERYYLAIQIFKVSGYAENVSQFRDFFKFRKMLVVNPKTGQAVVAVIGDAGPAEWTGKHLGGSPEVMDSLGLAEGPRRGPVLYFFIDDSKDEIPLGPIKVKEQA